jgi:hypothetical protein
MSILQLDRLEHLPPAAATHGEFRILFHLASDARDDGRRMFLTVPRLIAVSQCTSEYVALALRRFAARGWYELLARDPVTRRQLDWVLTLPSRADHLACGKRCGNAVDLDGGCRSYDRHLPITGSHPADPTIGSTRSKSLETGDIKAPPVLYPSLYPSSSEQSGCAASLEKPVSDPDKPPDLTGASDRDRALAQVRLAMLKSDLAATAAVARRRRRWTEPR